MANPMIRFKRDNGTEYPDWTDDTLGNLGTFTKGAPLSKADISQDGTPFILYGELYTTYSEVAMDIVRKTDKSVDGKYYSRIGDVIIPTSGESPEEISTATCVMKDGVILAGDLNIYRTHAVDGRIMSYLLNHQANHKIAVIAQGKSIVHIQAKELEDIEVSYPTSPEEQQKIAALFTEVDNLISAVSDEVSALEEAKKGMMQKIFSQKVRFRRDDGTEYPDWEELPLGEIVEQNNIPVDNPGSNYVKLAIRSHCKGTFHKPIESDDEGLAVDKMYLVEANNLIVNITFAWEHAIAITKPEDAGTYVSHRFPQYRFVNNNISAFYEYVIKNPRMKYEMGLCSPGGAGRNRVLNQNDFLLIPMVRPCPEEQQKIAGFLSSMDDAIAAAKDELAGYHELKKGLLQQMFA